MLSDAPNISATFIVHLSGYVIGIILYAMLLGLVFRSWRVPIKRKKEDLGPSSPRWLALWTGILGFVWNVGALLAFVLPQVNLIAPPTLSAISVTALGFLPAVVVLAVVDTQSMGISVLGRQVISGIGFFLSGWAGMWHLSRALFDGSATHTGTALEMMAWGFLFLLSGLLVARAWARGWDQMGTIVVVTGAAIAALPFSQHQTGDHSWGMELVGHHSNLLLALVILFHDYRFAFCDLFLKRALSFLGLTLLTLGVLSIMGIPIMKDEPAHSMAQISKLGVFLTLWVATALAYPYLQRGVFWLVDAVMLRRPDYEQLRQTLAMAINKQEDPQTILTTTAAILQPALLATHIRWREDPQAALQGLQSHEHRVEGSPTSENTSTTNGVHRRPRAFGSHQNRSPVMTQTMKSAFLLRIPTVEGPYYTFVIDGLLQGRQLLSDDLRLLEGAGHLVARRIDTVRSAHERCAITIREQEMKKLTVEAELRALRTQLNPHFLFNALTTIGYLIQTTPAQALETLLRLSELLRAVLKRLEGEFSTLGQEVDLVQSYLMIEQARFEKRLVYHIDVPSMLRGCSVPALLLQPLAENAVKHGIQQSSKGGMIKITAEVSTENVPSSDVSLKQHSLLLTIHNSGSGAKPANHEQAYGTGIGLSNIRKRLHLHYGTAASFHMHQTSENGTVVQIQLPIPETEIFDEEPFSCSSSGQDRER